MTRQGTATIPTITRVFLGCVLSFVCTIGVTAWADDSGGRIALPDDVFYYEPAAVAQGAAAIWTNPAGLGKLQASGFQLMADYYRGNYAKSWGSVVYRDRLVTGYRHIDNPDGTNYHEWLAGGGFALGHAVRLGFSYRHFRDGPGIYNNRHLWTLGTILAGRGNLRFGAVWSNLNRGRVDGERTAVAHRYSLAYRGLSRKLILSADMFLSSRQSVRDAEFAYNVEFTPIRGLYLTGFVDSDRNIQVGVRANLYKYITGFRTSTDRDGHNGRTTAYIGATNRRQPSLLPEPKRQLAMGINGGMRENPPQPVFGRGGTPFVTLLMEVYRAAEDPSIGELKLSLRGLALGFGQAQELREALAYFRSRGKRVICHLSAPNNIGYYLASVADTVLIPPVSQVRLVGLRAELTFYAGTLDKIGVQIELLRSGAYKTAPERYTNRSSSEEYREQINRLLDDWFDQFVDDIARGRGMTADSVRALIDRGPLTSAEALECGLVDGLSYRDQVNEFVNTRLPEISFHRYRADTVATDDWPADPIIGLVVAEGDITTDGGAGDPLGRTGGVTPSPMAGAFARVRSDPNVKGVVLRINSPGGSALAGEDIHRHVARAADAKPVAISMANIAASGGYYIATPGRRVFVDPATVTGSIGIYGGKADFSGLYEKLDIGKELYTRGRFAGLWTTTRPFTDAERAKYQSHLDAFYKHFVELVAESRNLSADSVDNISGGRVWTGRQAVSNGLADELGGVKAAIEYIAEQTGVERYRLEILPKKRPWILLPGSSLISRLLSIVGIKSDDPAGDVRLPVLTGDETLLARLPYDITLE